MDYLMRFLCSTKFKLKLLIFYFHVFSFYFTPIKYYDVSHLPKALEISYFLVYQTTI